MEHTNTKKLITTVLALALLFLLFACENNKQSSNVSYKEGYAEGYEAGLNDGNKKYFAQFSGSFTATVEKLIPDYYALPGNTIAVVHFFSKQTIFTSLSRRYD